MLSKIKRVLDEFPVKMPAGIFRKSPKSEGDDPAIVKESPASADNPKHVVVVMDGMRRFTTELLEWALENLIPAGCTVTLLGVMPWLNIPLSTKTWLDVWTLELEDSTVAGGQATNEEWRNGVKYVKLKAIIDLCNRYRVSPHKEVVMGYPKPLLVAEKISSLHATCVVFDRHQRKNMEFCMERLPCMMVMMNEDGGADMIKSRPVIGTPSVSSSVSELLRRVLQRRRSPETTQTTAENLV